MESNGFEVINVSRERGGEYNVALVRVDGLFDLTGLQRTVDTLAQEVLAFIETYKSVGKRVAVWGGGGKGIAVLAITNVRDIACLVDSDQYKQGYSHLSVNGVWSHQTG